jgi:hypothetical protein
MFRLSFSKSWFLNPIPVWEAGNNLKRVKLFWAFKAKTQRHKNAKIKEDFRACGIILKQLCAER